MKTSSSAVLQTKMALSGENVESLAPNTERPISLSDSPPEMPFSPAVGARPRLAFTPENQKAAQAALKARRAAGAHLRHDFADAELWVELAKAKHLRLPEWTVAMTPGGMEKWLRRCGLTITDYRAWSGFKALTEFAAANPDWPLRAFAGLMLEEQAYHPKQAPSAPVGVRNKKPESERSR